MPFELSSEVLKKALIAPGNQPNLDPVTAALLPFVELARNNWKEPAPPAEILPEGWMPGLANAMISWWKRAKGEEMPTFASVKPYGDSARAFMTEIGGYMVGSDRIPWGRINLSDTTQMGDVLSSPIRWDVVKAVVDALPVEVVNLSSSIEPGPYYQTQSWAWKTLADRYDWPATPWEKIPWNLPWSYLPLQGVRKAISEDGSPDAVTEAFLYALQEAYLTLAAGSGSSDIDLPDDWKDGGAKDDGAKAKDDGTDTPPEGKKRDGWEKVAIGATVVSAIAIAIGTALSLNKRRNRR